MKKRRIPAFGIYALIDPSLCGQSRLSAIVKQCLKAEVKLIQLRDKTHDTAGFYKNALLIRRLLKDEVLYIINDRLDIVQAVRADGVHLGQNDLPLKAARAILGPQRIIGKSCHNLRQAIRAKKEGADYISIGPIFKTPTKPGYRPAGLKVLRQTCRRLKIPVVAIGGINTDNIEAVRNAGARLIAVVRAICKARDIGKAIAGLGSPVNKALRS